MESLLVSFKEYSVIWFVISGVIGGVVGASIKLIFEDVFPSYLKRSREARQALETLKLPTTQAADSLDRRLENLILHNGEKWYQNPDDGYYRISTLYLFGNFLGWCKILEDETFLRCELSNNHAKKFNIRFYSVFKGLTSFSYFKHLDQLEVEKATIPRLTLTAIGELMRCEKPGGTSKGVIGITEFVREFKGNEEFPYWFKNLDNLLSNLIRSNNDASWNRLVVFAINLRLFLIFLDEKNRMSKPRRINYLQFLNSDVKHQVLRELEKYKLMHLVEKE